MKQALLVPDYFLDLNLFMNDEWVTNGHFLIHKSLIRNIDCFKDELAALEYIGDIIFLSKQLTSDMILHFLPSQGSLKRFKKTGAKTDFATVFAAEDGDFVCIYESYAGLIEDLGLDCLWGTAWDKPLYSADSKFVIMAMKPNYQHEKKETP